MVLFSASRRIQAPPEVVFRVFTDLEGATRNIPAIRKIEILNPGPGGAGGAGGAFGKGTKWKETRVMFGREATETLEVTRFDPPRGYTVEAESCGTHYETTFTFRPEVGSGAGGSGGGTVAQMTFGGRPLTTGAKLMAGLMGWMMKKAVTKAMNQDLDALTAAAEKEAGR